MSKQTHSQDSNSDELKECIDCYIEAAEYDFHLFGDYDYNVEWIGISTT